MNLTLAHGALSFLFPLRHVSSMLTLMVKVPEALSSPTLQVSSSPLPMFYAFPRLLCKQLSLPQRFQC